MSAGGFGATKAALHRADAGFGRARAVRLAARTPLQNSHAHPARTPSGFSIKCIGSNGWRGLKDGAVALVAGPVSRIAHLAGLPVRLGRAAGTRGMPGLERQLRVEVRDEIAFDREVVKGLAHTAYVGFEMSPAGAPLIQRRIERDGYQRTFEHIAYEGAAQVPNAAAILATKGVVSRVSAVRAASTLAEFDNLGAASRPLLRELTATGVKFNAAEVVRIVRDPSGRIVFLERGTETAGLAHIVKEHALDFAQKGIVEAEIPTAVMKAVTKGDVIGYQGRGFSRPIYRVEFGGQTVDIAITTGDNGFVVGANPARLRHG
jgi:hypothetical protein